MLQINQVFDAWFNKGFKGPKCKTLLKLASSRIKLLKNKRENQLKQLRRELAQLLENGQESTARIRVEHIIREKNIMEAYDTLEHFCELLIVRMPIMESQRECPLDLKEAVASLIFAAPRASDLQELLEVQTMLSFKYGREFVTSATELRPDCGVNRLVIEKLSARAPTATVKLNLMKEIAEQHNIEWDPASTELEFSKAPQDLLDGPNQFIGPIQMSPIPCHEDDPQAQGSMSASLRQEEEFLLSSPPNPARMQSVDQMEEPKFVPFLVPPPNYGTEALSGRFYSPPRESSITQQSGLLEETLFQRSHSRTKSEGSMDLHDIIEAAEAAAESAEKAARAARAAAELARTRLSPKSSKSIPHEAMLQNDTVIPSTLGFKGSGNISNIHLTPDSYDWTQEYNGKQQQENDTMLYEQRVEDKSHQETLFTPNSYDWMQDPYGGKQQQDSYDWTQDSYGRKQQEDDSVPYKQHDYIFDDYRDRNESADGMPPLHHRTSGEEKESIFTPSSRVQHGHGGGSHQPIYDVPKFDGSETATYSERFQRQPSLEDDPYYTYPNLFSKSSSG